MKKKPIVERLLATVLAVALVFNSVPMTVFAVGDNNFETERNTEIPFSTLVDTLVSDHKTDVSVTVEKEVNGEKVSTQIVSETDKNVVFFSEGLNSKDNTGVVFTTGGDYTLYKGVGTVNGTMKSEADYNALINAANDK